MLKQHYRALNEIYRAQLVTNTMASVFAYGVTACIGFVMPWLIYDSIGHTQLGLWDLGWSILIFVSLSGFGLGPALSYFIAGLTSEQTTTGKRYFTVALAYQLVFAAFCFVVFKLGFDAVSHFLSESHPEDKQVLSKLGTVLGFTIFVTLLGDVARSLLVGVHRSKTSEYISIAHDVSLSVCMIFALLGGYGIYGLAVATAGNRILFELVRFWYARHFSGFVQADLPERNSHIWNDLFRYSIKSSAFAIQEHLALQTARLLLFVSAGPIALATFSRYATLYRQINGFVDRIGLSVPAMISRFEAEGARDKTRKLYVGFAQLSMLVTLPLICVLGISGDTIVSLWMGDAFVEKGLAPVFAAGALLYSNYSASVKVLSGMNMHGKITLQCLAFSGLALLFLSYLFYPHSQKEAAALVAFVTLSALHIPYILYVSRKLELPWTRTMLDVNLKPVLCNLLFAGILLLTEHWVAMELYVPAGLAILSGIAWLGLIYWFYAIEPSVKGNLLGYLRLEERSP